MILQSHLWWCCIDPSTGGQFPKVLSFLPSLRCSRTWSTRELLGAPVTWSQHAGTRVPILGSSVILVRNRSNFSLNSVIEHFVTFLTASGRQLNSLAQCTWKDDSLSDCIFFGAVLLMGGTLHRRPPLPESHWMTPGFGTSPSRTFQIYTILYLSKRLCWLFSFNVFNLSQ